MAAGSVQENGNAPADDGSVAGCECMTVNKADAEAACATNIQEASAVDHKQPQDCCTDADWVCQQPTLNPEQKHLQGDGMEGSQQVMAHDKAEVRHVEEQEEDEEEKDKKDE